MRECGEGPFLVEAYRPFRVNSSGFGLSVTCPFSG